MCNNSRRRPTRPGTRPVGQTRRVPDAAAATAEALRRRHEQGAIPPSTARLVDYAESTRAGDWSLRSALVRVAQPEPVRAGAVLELIRRTDGALAPHRRALERNDVRTDRRLSPALRSGDGDLAEGEPRADARATDLARVLVRFDDGGSILDAYASATGVGADERRIVDLLTPAVLLDELADALTDWAEVRAGPPPVGVIDAVSARAFGVLESLGVPRESGPPRGGRRRG